MHILIYWCCEDWNTVGFEYKVTSHLRLDTNVGGTQRCAFEMNYKCVVLKDVYMKDHIRAFQENRTQDTSYTLQCLMLLFGGTFLVLRKVWPSLWILHGGDHLTVWTAQARDLAMANPRNAWFPYLVGSAAQRETNAWILHGRHITQTHYDSDSWNKWWHCVCPN